MNRAGRASRDRRWTAVLWLVGAVLMAALGLTFAWRATRRSDAPPPATCDELSASAKRGRLVFRRGVTAAGAPIRGLLGGGPAMLTGRDAACAGCHTPSGAGADEGGVAAPPITPEHLFSDALDRGERSRRAYDEASLGRAVREGRAPSGKGVSARQLGMAMPRYGLAEADLADLTAYLRCVGHDRDPGVSEGALKVGAALPLSGPLATVGGDVHAVLAASFAEVGEGGGIFRRRLDLVVEDSAAPGRLDGTGASERRARAWETLDEAGATERLIGADVFALVGNVWRGERAPGERARAEEIPLVAPVGPLDPGSASAGPTLDGGDDGTIFYVHAGPDALARIAVKELAGADGSARPRIVVAHARDRAGEAWLRGARAEAARRGLAVPEVFSFEPGRLDATALAEAVRERRSTAVLLWGTAADLTAAAAAIERLPGVRLDAPGYLLGAAPSALPAPVRDRVFFIEPSFGGEAHGAGVADFRAFLRRHDIAPRHLAVQARARVAALVLIEALKRTGARVTRDGLVAALETFRDFDTGLVAPLSYGKSRRVGVLGASLLRVDGSSGETVRASQWIGIAP